jgi:hypothetical protein
MAPPSFSAALLKICLGWVWLPLLAAEAPRTFTAADGRTLAATLLAKTATSATIRSATDGQTYTLQLDRFSEADQEYIRNWRGGALAPAPSVAGGPLTAESVDGALKEARRLSESADAAGALAIYEDLVARPPSSDATLTIPMFDMFRDWAKLASKHPPALESLRRGRAARAASLLAGDAGKDTFAQLATLDRAIATADPLSKGATARLFRKIEEKHPELARECFGLAKIALFEARDVELFGKYLPDLEPDLEVWIADYRAEYAVLKPRDGDALIAENEANLRNFADFLAEIADSRGQGTLAAELKAKVDAAVREASTTAPAP